MERFLKVSLLFCVAGVAQLNLCSYQQVLQFCVMHGVAGCAGDTVLIVCGTHEFTLLWVGFVAGHATLCDCFRPHSFEVEYLALVASSVHMSGAGSMARFAAMTLFATNLAQPGCVMRTRFDVLELIFVAALAGIGADVFRTTGWITSVRGGSRLCRTTKSSKRLPQTFQVVFSPDGKKSAHSQLSTLNIAGDQSRIFSSHERRRLDCNFGVRIVPLGVKNEIRADLGFGSCAGGRDANSLIGACGV